MSISVGSVSVDVVPDTRGFVPQLKTKLKGVTATIALDANIAPLKAKLDEATRPRTATITVEADTAIAEAQLDTVARDRRASVAIGGIGAAVAGVSALGVTVASLGPAILPITAAVAGLALALAGPIAVAGGGLTLGALIAGKAISDTREQQKQIADLATKVQAAKAAVASAATPEGRKSALVREAEAVKAYRSALDALTPAQAKFIAAQSALSASFKGLVSSAGPAIFGPVIKGMDLLADVLPKVKPLIVGVSGGISTLLKDLGKAASGPAFGGLVKAFGSAARSSIVSFGRIFGNVTTGLVGFFRAFGPLSKAFVGGLRGASRAFAEWGSNLSASKSFQGFLGYLKDVGPKAASAVGHLFSALGKVAVVLAPLGSMSLALVDGVSKFIATAKPTTLAAIAVAIGAVGLAITGAAAPTLALVGLGVALGGGLAYLVTKVEPLNKAFRGLSGWVTGSLLPAFRDAWQTVLPGLMKGFDSVKRSVRDNEGLFRVLGDVFKGIGSAITGVVIPAVAKFYSIYLPALGKAIGVALTTVRLLAVGFTYLATAGLESFKFLASGAFAAFGSIVDAAVAGLGWLPGIGDKIKGAKRSFDQFRDNTVAALDVAIGKVADLRNDLNGLKPKTITVTVVPKYLAKPIDPLFGPGIQVEGAGATGAIVNRPTVALIGEAGPEAVVPLNQTAGNAALPSGRAAVPPPQFLIEQVVAQDVNDFLRQMQARSRMAGIGGLPQ